LPTPVETIGYPRTVTNTLEGQIALARHGISAGSIDGRGGAQTAAAFKAFQMQNGLNQTGWLDRETRQALNLDEKPFRPLRIEPQDIERLQPVPTTWLGKSELDRLDFETILELVAERSASHPGLIVRLNPGLNWNRVEAGTEVIVPASDYPPPRRAARARISLSGHWLRAFDDQANLLAHFPCSIARLAEKRPVGELHVTSVIRNPNYTFDPAVFPESEEGRELGRKLVIPPGPNNPVGIAWIGLDRPGYGIHGTPRPEEIGRTESHGCFRLANWNADYFRRIAWVGMPVAIEP
jgi:lipoprotein-anchoring transpeptidase ErfK/SrfK